MSLPCKINPLGVYRLPAGYLSALFLESDATPYLDTGITLNGDSVVSFTYQNVDIGVQHDLGCIFGARESATLRNFTYYDRVLTSGGNMYFGYNNESTLVAYSLKTETVTYVKIDGPSWRAVNSERTISHDFEYGSFETYTAYLFTYHIRGGADERGYIGRIYTFSVGTPTKKQRDFIPTLDAQGVPCMFDKVTKQPFYNEGEGAFIVGLTAVQARKLGKLPDGGGTLTISLPSDVVDENGVLVDMAIFTALSQAASKGWSFILQTHDGTAVDTAVPAGYMECDFLESTGTQYIDTGIKLSSESEVNCTYSAEKVEGTQGLYGSFTPPRFSTYGAYGSLFYAYIANLDGKMFSLTLGKKNRVKHTSTSIIFNDSEKFFEEVESFTQVGNCGLYGSNGGMNGWFKVFDFAIANSGTPQANYTPAITPAGVPCMYDSVSGEAKLNSGTGAFICGMTAAQAVQLANLPTGGGELTVSLPQSILNGAGEITDAAVRAALNKAAENGWTITLQYYTEQ